MSDKKTQVMLLNETRLPEQNEIRKAVFEFLEKTFGKERAPKLLEAGKKFYKNRIDEATFLVQLNADAIRKDIDALVALHKDKMGGEENTRGIYLALADRLDEIAKSKDNKKIAGAATVIALVGLLEIDLGQMIGTAIYTLSPTPNIKFMKKPDDINKEKEAIALFRTAAGVAADGNWNEVDKLVGETRNAGLAGAVKYLRGSKYAGKFEDEMRRAGTEMAIIEKTLMIAAMQDRRRDAQQETQQYFASLDTYWREKELKGQLDKDLEERHDRKRRNNKTEDNESGEASA